MKLHINLFVFFRLVWDFLDWNNSILLIKIQTIDFKWFNFIDPQITQTSRMQNSSRQMSQINSERIEKRQNQRKKFPKTQRFLQKYVGCQKTSRSYKLQPTRTCWQQIVLTQAHWERATTWTWKNQHLKRSWSR
jgi:hypothetical protein